MDVKQESLVCRVRLFPLGVLAKALCGESWMSAKSFRDLAFERLVASKETVSVVVSSTGVVLRFLVLDFTSGLPVRAPTAKRAIWGLASESLNNQDLIQVWTEMKNGQNHMFSHLSL